MIRVLCRCSVVANTLCKRILLLNLNKITKDRSDETEKLKWSPSCKGHVCFIFIWPKPRSPVTQGQFFTQSLVGQTGWVWIPSQSLLSVTHTCIAKHKVHRTPRSSGPTLLQRISELILTQISSVLAVCKSRKLLGRTLKQSTTQC